MGDDNNKDMIPGPAVTEFASKIMTEVLTVRSTLPLAVIVGVLECAKHFIMSGEDAE